MKDVVKKEGDPGWGELGDWDGPQAFRKFVSFFFSVQNGGRSSNLCSGPFRK